MANTRDIRRRIKSIKNTAQITKAMQMVAASKMRKAQQAALASRPYAELMNRIIRSAGERVNISSHPLVQQREGKRRCVVVITTDKGLCGALNTNLLRVAAGYDTQSTSFVSAGRKGRAYLSRTKRDLLADFEVSDALTFADARSIGKFVVDLYTEEKVDRVDALFTNFVNTLTQKPEALQLLPVSPKVGLNAGIEESETTAAAGAKENLERADYEYEPDATEVLSAILPHYVNYQIWHCLLEAKASEHSSRMVAMKSATDNALQLVKDLTLEYNKIRQASITSELLEIASAQMALD